MAENRRSSSPDSLFVSPDPHYNNNAHPAQRQPPLALPPTTAHRARYAGDGLDYRRPARTTAGMGSDVIDLTSEDDSRSARIIRPEAPSAAATPEPGPSRTRQRLPNFPSRNIIDVESDLQHEGQEREAASQGGARAGPSGHHIGRTGHREGSREDHHFTAPHYPPRDIDMASRNRAAAAEPTRRLPRPWDGESAHRSITPHPSTNAQGHATIDLTADDDDDVVFTEIRPRVTPQLNTGRPEATAGIGTRGVMDGVLDLGGRTAAAVLGRMFGPGAAIGAVDRHRILIPGNPRGPDMGALNINLEYTLAAFQVGAEPNRPPTPLYEPPPKAEAGFTRSPGENEEVVCPNCGDELCMGDNDVKQEVWVIKGCGHVSWLTFRSSTLISVLTNFRLTAASVLKIVRRRPLEARARQKWTHPLLRCLP